MVKFSFPDTKKYEAYNDRLRDEIAKAKALYRAILLYRVSMKYKKEWLELLAENKTIPLAVSVVQYAIDIKRILNERTSNK